MSGLMSLLERAPERWQHIKSGSSIYADRGPPQGARHDFVQPILWFALFLLLPYLFHVLADV
jgi:hypothetical protein